jgi:uncharacterized membrane protein
LIMSASMPQDEQMPQQAIGIQVDSALARVVAFSDGIFAVAITILVLVLAVPDLGSRPTDAALQTRLVALVPSILSFVLSFAIVGLYWLSHHRLFQVVNHLDRKALYANLFFLLTICFVPFPTGVIGHYGELRTAAIFYAGSMVVTGLALAVLWWLAALRPARQKSEKAVSQYFMLRALGTAAVFAISTPVILLSPTWGERSWIAVLPVYLVLSRIYRQSLTAALRPSI